MTRRAFADEQQVTVFDYPREMGDGDCVTAFTAPNTCEQYFFVFTGDACPQISRCLGKFRDGFDRHVSFYRRVCVVLYLL